MRSMSNTTYFCFNCRHTNCTNSSHEKISTKKIRFPKKNASRYKRKAFVKWLTWWTMDVKVHKFTDDWIKIISLNISNYI